MNDELTYEIASTINRLGYKNIMEVGGIIYYTDKDGTHHRLIEDTCVDGKWESNDNANSSHSHFYIKNIEESISSIRSSVVLAVNSLNELKRELKEN